MTIEKSAKPCDNLNGTCDDYPVCPCGAAWKEREAKLRSACSVVTNKAARAQSLGDTDRGNGGSTPSAAHNKQSAEAVADMEADDGVPYTVSANDESEARMFELDDCFVEWLDDDWQEKEV